MTDTDSRNVERVQKERNELLGILKEIVAAGSPSPYAARKFDERIDRAIAIIARAEGRA